MRVGSAKNRAGAPRVLAVDMQSRWPFKLPLDKGSRHGSWQYFNKAWHSP